MAPTPKLRWIMSARGKPEHDVGMSRSAPPLLPTPDAGFDQPFEMLLACHERVERMLGLLERLALHLQSHGADDQALDAAQQLMRYFDLAAPAHHEDEERHVIPLLAKSHPALARQLLDEHEQMTQQWQRVRADLVALSAQTAASASQPAARWSTFVALYRRHLLAEEKLAFVTVRPQLSDPDLQLMSQEMAQRRSTPLRRP